MDLAINNSIPLKTKNIARNNQVQKSPFVQFNVPKKNSPIPSSISQAYLLPQINQGYKKVEVFDVPNVGKATTFELLNGHKITILPKKGSCEICTYVKTDYLEDITTSHFLEHLLADSENTFNNSTYKKEISKMGAISNATTKPNNIEYRFSYPFNDKKDIETLIQMQAEMLQKPQFNQEKFEQEKGILISEYTQNDKNTQNMEDENSVLKKRIINSLFGANLSLNTTSNEINQVKNITLADIQAFYNKYYQNQNMQTIIVGDVNPDEIIKTFAKYFNKVNVGTKVQDVQFTQTTLPQKAQRFDFKFNYNKGNLAQINFSAFSSDSGKDFVIAQLLSELAKIRESDFEIDFINAKDQGIKPVAFVVKANYENNDRNANLAQLQKDFIVFLNSEITQKEFETIKKRRKFYSLAMMEYSQLLAQHLQTQNPSKDYPIQEAKYLSEITINDLKNFISNYLKLDKALYITVSDNLNTLQRISFKGSKDTFKINANEYIYPNNLQLLVNSDDENKQASYCLNFETEDLRQIKPATLNVLSYLLQLAIRDNCKHEIPYEPYLNLSANSLYISGTSNPEDVVKLINLINDASQYRQYSNEYFEYVKNILKGQMQDDEFFAKLTELNFADNQFAHPLSRFTKKEDKIKAIDDVTLVDVYELLDRITKNSQAKASLALPKTQFENNKNEIFNAISSGFNWQFQPKKEIDLEKLLGIKPNTSTRSKVLLDIKNDDNASVCFSFKIAGCKDEKEAIAADMLSIILNERIFKKIREELGISYYLGATYEQDSGSNHLNLQCEFKANKTNFKDLERVIKELQNEVNKICTNSISKEELESLKLKYKKYWLENSYTTTGKAGLLNSFSIKENNEKYQVIDSITEIELLQSAKTYLATKPNIIIRANKDVINSNIGYITTLGQLV